MEGGSISFKIINYVERVCVLPHTMGFILCVILALGVVCLIFGGLGWARDCQEGICFMFMRRVLVYLYTMRIHLQRSRGAPV